MPQWPGSVLTPWTPSGGVAYEVAGWVSASLPACRTPNTNAICMMPLNSGQSWPGRPCRKASPSIRCHPRPRQRLGPQTELSRQLEGQLDHGLGRRRNVARDDLSPWLVNAPDPPMIGSVKFKDLLTITPWSVICPRGSVAVAGHWASTCAALAVDTNVQTTPTRPTCSPLCTRLPENTTSSPRLKPGAPRSIFGSN